MPVIPAQSHQPATTDAQIFAECAERLRIAQQAEGENRQRAVLALEFEDGQQWPDDLYNLRKVSKRPTLTINHTRTFVRRVVNNMRQQRPRIKVHAVGDGAEPEMASKIGGLIRHVENRSDGAIAYDIAGESAVKIGWGYFRILTEYVDEDSFDQEIRILPIRNTFTVYMDPAATGSGEDMEWCIISEKMKRSEFERKYPKEEQTEWREGGAGDQGTDWETKEEIRLAEYFRITRKKDTLVKLTTGESVYKSEMQDGQVIAKQLNGQDFARPTMRRQVEWYRLNGTTVVQNVELPGKWIPVVRCEGNVLELNGTVRRKGMIEDMMDTARMYNYWRTCETEMIALAPRAPWMGTANQFAGHNEWNDANQKPYSKLTYNPDFIDQPDGTKTPLPPPTRVETIQIPAGFVNAAEGAAKDLMALAGMPHEPGVDKPGEVVSGVALRRRQALSDIGHFQYYDNQTRAIAHGGRIQLEYIRAYYSTQRMQRILGEDGTPETIELNTPDPVTQKIKDDVTVGRFDVVMDTGPGYETKRQEGAEQLIDLLKIQPVAEIVAKNGADLLFRSIDGPYSEQLADRVMPMNPEGMDKAMKGLPEQARNIITAMQRQLQQKDQLIQQQGLELKYKGAIEQGWMKTEIDKENIKAGVKVHDTRTNADTKREDTHVKAQASIAVAEIGAAGQLLNTNTEAAHDRAAAKEMIQAAGKAEKKSDTP
jgi:hypothetical protein